VRHHFFESEPFMDTSRREVLAVAAATVTLPMLQSALNATRSAAAQQTPRGNAGGNRGPASSPAEKPGWFTTKLKAAELKDNEFTAVEGHPGIVLSRQGKDVAALTTKCTHKGCTIKPKAAVKTMTCACHQAQFNLDGTVAKAPAQDPLSHFAIRLNGEGLVEIDPGQTPAADAKEYKATLA
jgi:Rieske Fe-S protein